MHSYACAFEGWVTSTRLLSPAGSPSQALADYMESKRRAFPRFYFVSTADLLDILSNGSNPVHIMQHMSKCFQVLEGVWRANARTNERGWVS